MLIVARCFIRISRWKFIIFYINAFHDGFIIFCRRIQRLSRIFKVAAERTRAWREPRKSVISVGCTLKAAVASKTVGKRRGENAQKFTKCASYFIETLSSRTVAHNDS